ncbi:MAG: homoserine O-acetyltransferase [Actinomycetota bacterium]|nr:homoserine O-acetyltransferase [Actinomycetota bacterium]
MDSRRYADLGPVELELGEVLPAVRMAYQTWGTPRLAGGRVTNAVLVLHALTGDAHVAGPVGPDQPTPGWWDGLIGPGRALDPARWFVLAPNVLGGCRGTTGPASPAPDGRPWGSRFPRITIRDQVRAEALLADHLGIDRFAAVIGGSMGGMRVLEWLIGYPDRVSAGLVLAACAAATADQIGTQTAQILAIRSDPAWQDGDYHDSGPGPVTGLGLARRIAHLTYRTETEMDARFGRQAQGAEDPLRGGRFEVQSYLDHHADKLVARFDAGCYVVLTEAMNSHDVGRGRGGARAALARITAPVVVGGVDSDRLYPLRLQQDLAAAIPTCDRVRVIRSPYGHDAFLIEIDQVAALVREALNAAAIEPLAAINGDNH